METLLEHIQKVWHPLELSEEKLKAISIIENIKDKKLQLEVFKSFRTWGYTYDKEYYQLIYDGYFDVVILYTPDDYISIYKKSKKSQ